MTNRKKAIKKLSTSYQKYDLQVEATTSGTNGLHAAKSIIQILTDSEKGPVVQRRSSAYGFGNTLQEAQDDAVVQAIQNLGL